ncbi:MAG: DUF559 domain-containing protein [Thermofilaceae archaeon]
MPKVKLVREVVESKHYVKILYGDVEGKVKVDAKVFEKLTNFLRNSLNLNVDPGKLRICLQDILEYRVDEAELDAHPLIKIKHKKAIKTIGGLLVSREENLLAKYLKKCGLKFARQAEIAGYRVDFLVYPNIVVEVDGLQHEWKGKDAEKVKKIEKAGYIVYRFTTKDVREDAEGIARFVKEVVDRKNLEA